MAVEVTQEPRHLGAVGKSVLGFGLVVAVALVAATVRALYLREPAPSSIDTIDTMSRWTDADTAVSKKLDVGRVPANLVNLSLTDFFLAVAREYDAGIDGLGHWSDRLNVSACGERGWTATQVLNATRDHYETFGWSIREGRIKVYPMSRGEPLLLEDEDNITVQLLEDKQTVQATDSRGAVLWKTNVVEACGPELGPPTVWRIFPFFRKGYVFVSLRHSASVSINLKTGVATCEGSD